MPEVTLLPRSTVFGYHDYNFLTINQRLSDHLPLAERPASREKLWQVRAQQVVLATGAAERPLIFANNDRPGIMLASAASIYSNRYAVQPGSRAVVFTNNDSAYQSALDLKAAGVEVEAVVDARAGSDSELANTVRSAGIQVINGSVVIDTAGRKRLSSVQVMRLSAEGSSVSGETRALSCDLLAVSGGWSPVVHLNAQSGAKPVWDEANAMFRPGEPTQAQFSAGGANGTLDLAGCLQEGAAAGNQAAIACGFEASTQPARCRRRRHRARGARRIQIGRTRETLHRDGLRHRPGQARQHQRDGYPGRQHGPEYRRHRHHDLSPQLHAGELWRLCRAKSR
jgi:sarcosine oxidase subunit alpha